MRFTRSASTRLRSRSTRSCTAVARRRAGRRAAREGWRDVLARSGRDDGRCACGDPAAAAPAVRWGLGVVAFIVALNLSPSRSARSCPRRRPASSSYATSSQGLAAYAELLSKLGHPVTRLREAPADVRLDPRSTVVLLDPQSDLGPEDVGALRNFAAAGGRVVAGGADTARWRPRCPERRSPGRRIRRRSCAAARSPACTGS